MILYIAVSTTVLILLLCFAGRPKNHLTQCIHHVARLPTDRLDSVVEFCLEDTTALAGPVFWSNSGRVRGHIQRVIELTHVCRVLQACVMLGIVPQDRAHHVRRLATLQVFYSLLALPEAAFCAVAKGYPHLAALVATRLHWQATVQTVALCQVEGAPEFLLAPDILL